MHRQKTRLKEKNKHRTTVDAKLDWQRYRPACPNTGWAGQEGGRGGHGSTEADRGGILGAPDQTADSS